VRHGFVAFAATLTREANIANSQLSYVGEMKLSKGNT
jgi:hypothetical protein